MDTDTDDSERWEDFFGSSTDLTPSLIGIYDSLTSGDKISNNCNLINHSTDNLSKTSTATVHEKLYTAKSIESLDKTTKSNLIENLLTKKNDCNLNKDSKNCNSNKTTLSSITNNNNTNHINKHRSFHVFSPNVQRIISHSNTIILENDEKLHASNECLIYNNCNNTNNNCNSNGIKLTSKRNRVKLSHIPLSKNTSKLTQAGSELVETFDTSSCESILNINLNNVKKLEQEYLDGDQQTPTNLNIKNFSFDLQNNENYLNHSSKPEKFNDMLKMFSSIKATPKIEDNVKKSDTKKTNDKNSMLAVEENLKGLELSKRSLSPKNCKNIDSKRSKELDGPTKKLTELIDQQKKPKSPLLTYARVKLLDNCSSPIKSPLNSNSNQKKPSLDDSSESLDQLTDIKYSPKNGNRKNCPMPDLIKLKHIRPISICSTSSSSSSGSEIVNGKVGQASYLASVESLADHSENEIMDPNNSLTIFERSCLEIVDSERSYVEDLRQIIKGYLEDWKERACLKIDEIKILFSNIQEIYDFNTILLKQLINSGMDPVKISKCFIDLKDKFEVYTKYCTSYPDAISLLTTLLQASHTNALLTSTQKMLKHTLPLGSYLLKPVQRILKYHLLLDNLRKHCDFEEILHAHEIMRDVARNIDQVKKKLEQQSRVKELSGILDGWLGPELTVLGELRLEGLLMENNKPRMVFLFETMLIITKPKEDNRLQFKSYIYRNNLMLREHLPGEPTSFNVIPYDEPRHQIKLCAKNRDQKRTWAQNIKGVILEQFNIPNRAKELVYQLGDEEERTPDKNIWKWGLNTSSSTPVYLERRNQYRRSEMKNRSRNKRKTVSNSTSFESFSNKSSTDNLQNKSQYPRQLSVDDNMMVSLKLNNSYDNFDESIELIAEHDTNDSGKNKKERSKSVPRLITVGKSDIDENASNKSRTPEIKMYTAKTIPKRIANLKKNRSKKETSKFYMTIDEMQGTILKITESTENLKNETIESEEELQDNNNESKPKYQKDSDIISALIKESKEFDKILNKKSPKRKISQDNSRIVSTEVDAIRKAAQSRNSPPPPPPATTPPPFERPNENKMKLEEPIYESLLRNVHVPYKYSPILNRSKSQQYYRNSKERIPKPVRPESDYVTLVYSESGDLQSIGNTLVTKTQSADVLRNSDSNINYEKLKLNQNSSFNSVETVDKLNQKPFLHRFISMKTENVSVSENSLLTKAKLSIENLQFGKNSNKPPERRVSDVSEMCRQSIIHRQGSEAVGERMAHAEYADPKTLFNCSANSSVVSLQRDSVFSLTSSSDSVKTEKTSCNLGFNYEENVESCLENDFRDSAVYSDDNDRRQDFQDFFDTIKRPNSPPPPPPTIQLKCKILKEPKGDLSPPPLLSPKPSLLPKPALIIKPINNKIQLSALSPATIEKLNNKSWVLQQIENFNKD